MLFKWEIQRTNDQNEDIFFPKLGYFSIFLKKGRVDLPPTPLPPLPLSRCVPALTLGGGLFNKKISTSVSTRIMEQRYYVEQNKQIIFMLIARPDSKWKNLDQTSFLIICFFPPHKNFGCGQLISYIKYVSFHSPLRGVIYHILFSLWLWLRRRFVFGGEIW